MLPIFEYDNQGNCLMNKVNITELDVITTISEFIAYRNDTKNPDLSAFFKKNKTKNNVIRALALVGLSSCINDIMEIQSKESKDDKENTGN